MTGLFTAWTHVCLILLLIASGLVRAAEPASVESAYQVGHIVIVGAEGAELHAGGKVVAQVPAGIAMKVAAVRGVWLGGSVQVDGKPVNGWLNAGRVGRQEASGIPAASPARSEMPPLATGAKWQTTVRMVVDATTAKEAREGNVWITEGGKRVAYVRDEGNRQYMIVDGKAGKGYKAVAPLGSQVFFPSGEHFAYVATEGIAVDERQECVVCDGREGPWHRMVWSSDVDYSGDGGERLSYKAMPLDGLGVAVIDGKAHAADAMPGKTLLIGGHYAYIDMQQSGDNWTYTFVCDGKRDKPYGWIDEESVRLTRSGAYGYAAKDTFESDVWRCNINGTELPDIYGGFVLGLTFSADGQHFAFAARHESGAPVVVVDGKEYPSRAYAWWITFSADGVHWASAVFEDDKAEALLDGKVLPSVGKQIQSVEFSPDGSRLGWLAGDDVIHSQYAVVDGQPGPRFHEVRSLTFAPDGRRFAYAAQREQNGPWFVVVDGKEGREYEEITALNFGLDGSYLAYKAKIGDKSECLVLDGQEQEKFKRILPGASDKLYLGLDSVGYVAAREGVYYWVEHRRVP